MSAPINYDPNTPITSQSFAEWQEQFIENFTQLNNAFQENHIALDAASGNGNHTVLEMLQREDPQATGNAELAVYSKDVEGQTDQIFIRNPANGVEYQFTNYQIYSLSATNPNQYFTFLPGKILCYFGLFTPNNPGPIKLFTLNPAIAKNILSVNFTSTVPVLGSGVTYSLNAPQNGIYKSLNVLAIGLPTMLNSDIHYYTIMANI